LKTKIFSSSSHNTLAYFNGSVVVVVEKVSAVRLLRLVLLVEDFGSGLDQEIDEVVVFFSDGVPKGGTALKRRK
jgi:hypothetical protein